MYIWKQNQIVRLWSCLRVYLSPLTDGWPPGRACDETPQPRCWQCTHCFLPLQPLALPVSAHAPTHTSESLPPLLPLTTGGDGQITFDKALNANMSNISMLHSCLICVLPCLWKIPFIQLKNMFLCVWIYFSPELDFTFLFLSFLFLQYFFLLLN